MKRRLGIIFLNLSLTFSFLWLSKSSEYTLVTSLLELGWRLGVSNFVCVSLALFCFSLFTNPLMLIIMVITILLYVLLKFLRIKDIFKTIVISLIINICYQFLISYALESFNYLLIIKNILINSYVNYLLVRLFKDVRYLEQKLTIKDVVSLFIISAQVICLFNGYYFVFLLVLLMLFINELFDVYLNALGYLIMLMFLFVFKNEMYLIILIPLLVSSFVNKRVVKILMLMVLNTLLINYYPNVNSFLFIIISEFIISFIIPKGVIRVLREYLFLPSEYQKEVLEKFKRETNLMTNKLKNIQSLFSLIIKEYQSDSSEKMYKRKEKSIYYSVCVSCHKRYLCYKSDKRLGEVVFKSVKEGLTKEEEKLINERCQKPRVLLNSIEFYQKDIHLEYKYQLEYQNLKDALILLLGGSKKAIEEFLDYDFNLSFKTQEEDLIKNEVSKYYDLRSVRVYQEFDHKIIKLLIKLKTKEELDDLVLKLEEFLNINLGIVNYFRGREEEYVLLELKTKNEHKLSSGVFQISKAASCGDSYLIFDNDKYYLFALSDGMGSGREASEESKFTLSLLKSLFSYIDDIDSDIKLINSLLKVKNHQDMYASLDLLLIDKRSLRAYFNKHGAPHSYIYFHNLNDLKEVSSYSLPIGIVNETNSTFLSYKLTKGDMVMMFSDGLKENIKDFKKYFFQVKDYHPQLISKEMCRFFKDVEREDDASFICVKIEN